MARFEADAVNVALLLEEFFEEFKEGELEAGEEDEDIVAVAILKIVKKQ